MQPVCLSPSLSHIRRHKLWPVLRFHAVNLVSIHFVSCRQPQLQLVGSSKAPSCIADMAASPHMGAEVAFICQDGSVHLLLLHPDSFAQAEAEQEGKEGQLPLAKVP